MQNQINKIFLCFIAVFVLCPFKQSDNNPMIEMKAPKGWNKNSNDEIVDNVHRFKPSKEELTMCQLAQD